MFKKFYPDAWENSTYEVDYQALYQEGIRGIIYDVDNTLVPHGAPADARAIALIQRLHEMGFSVMLLSNNKEPRVQSFAAQVVHAGYIFKANKPSTTGYLSAMEQMGTDLTNTIFIGDQLFTDVWGAKNTGLRNILVKPIDPHEEIQIVFKRCLEKIVLWFYKRKTKSGK